MAWRFPGIDPRLSVLDRLLPLEPVPDALRRLAAIVPYGSAGIVSERLKLSGIERTRLTRLTVHPADHLISLDGNDHAQRVAIYRLGHETYRDLVLIDAASQKRPDRAGPLLALSAGWTAPTLPVRGTDLVEAGVPPGPEIGRKLAAAEDWWIAGDFIAGRSSA